ncbi:hypothetical protein TcWFU_002988 [Taenia crassiceps]|uniref:Uncharacterized protein n=1 Tax=Taenia crassiceps TaxID=6207 RepID=A0ABR4QAP9_9CEST
METTDNNSALTTRGHYPLRDAHPSFVRATDFITVRLGRVPFVLDTEGVERVPAYLFTLFRTIHLEHLASVDAENPHSFIMLLNCWRSSPPVEDVRVVANFLSSAAGSLEDCMAVIEKQTALFNFNVLRMILKRNPPPVLYLDYDTCVTMEESNVVFPLGTFTESKMDGIFPTDLDHADRYQRYCKEATSAVYYQRISMQIAAINCYIFKDLMSIPNDFHRAVTRFIFYHLCTLIREVAIVECGNRRATQSLYFMPTAVFRSRKLRILIQKMVHYIAEDLICLDSRWVAHKYAQSNVSPYVDISDWMDREEAKMKRRAMMNILCSNINCLWLRGCSLEDFRFDDTSSAVVDIFKAEVVKRCDPSVRSQKQ